MLTIIINNLLDISILPTFLQELHLLMTTGILQKIKRLKHTKFMGISREKTKKVSKNNEVSKNKAKRAWQSPLRY